MILDLDKVYGIKNSSDSFFAVLIPRVKRTDGYICTTINIDGHVQVYIEDFWGDEESSRDFQTLNSAEVLPAKSRKLKFLGVPHHGIKFLNQRTAIEAVFSSKVFSD